MWSMCSSNALAARKNNSHKLASSSIPKQKYQLLWSDTLWFRWEMKYISLQTQQCGVSNYIPVCMPEMRHPQMYSVIFLQHICRQFGNGTCCCGEQVGAPYSSAGDISIYHLKVKTKRVVHCKAQTTMIWVRWFRSICPRGKQIGYYSIVITKQLPILENTMTLW